MINPWLRKYREKYLGWKRLGPRNVVDVLDEAYSNQRGAVGCPSLV